MTSHINATPMRSPVSQRLRPGGRVLSSLSGPDDTGPRLVVPAPSPMPACVPVRLAKSDVSRN
jgi:hypothetical protein